MSQPMSIPSAVWLYELSKDVPHGAVDRPSQQHTSKSNKLNCLLVPTTTWQNVGL